MTNGISDVLQRIDEITGRIQKIVDQARITPPDAQTKDFGKILDEVQGKPAGPSLPEHLRPLVEKASARHGIPSRVLEELMRQESGFNPRAVSPKGARGLMQLMPATQNMLGVGDAFDPEQAIDGGARYLRMMLDKFGGDLTQALAAYNAGPQAVDRHGGVPPYDETRNYVRKILGNLGAVTDEF